MIPWTVALHAPLVHGIFQTRILERVAIPCSRGSSRTRDRPSSPMSPTLAGRFFSTSRTWWLIGHKRAEDDVLVADLGGLTVWVELVRRNKGGGQWWSWSAPCIGKNSTDNKEEEGNYENRLLKVNSFLGLETKHVPGDAFPLGHDLECCFTWVLIQAHNLRDDISSFSSKKSILIQEVLSHLQFTAATLVSTCVVFP